jgi:hypothetical protein
MSECIVIPTFARPEILAHALMKISCCPDAPDDVRIFLDTSPESRVKEVEWIRDTYLPRALLFHAPEHVKATSGTWNILNSLKAGYETGAERVWLVEEDVLMKPGAFDYARKVLSGENNSENLASCGRRIPTFFARYGDLYTNPGSCLTRRLLKGVVPHINNDYFADTGGYITRTFQHPPFNSSLDDGLVRMVVREMGGQCVYPDRPICAHQGFDWYNEIDIYSNNEGTLTERIARFEKITSSIKPGDRYAQDFEPFNS